MINFVDNDHHIYILSHYHEEIFISTVTVEYKETGKEKMESKINFMKNELDKHSNIIMYLGSISHYANRE